jgi:DNA-binding CsgD family transcriptional regulator
VTLQTMTPDLQNNIGAPPLTGMEYATLVLLADGHTPTEITTELHISSSYVYSLIRLLKYRFDSKTIAGVVSHALQQGVISGEIIFSGKLTLI